MLTEMQKHDHPVDHLTELAKEMVNVLYQHEEPDISAVVILSQQENPDDEDRAGGVCIHHHSEESALNEMVIAAQSMAESMGMKLLIVGLPGSHDHEGSQ